MSYFKKGKKKAEAADALDSVTAQIEWDSKPQSIRKAVKHVHTIATASIRADQEHRQLDSATTEEMSPELASAMTTNQFGPHRERDIDPLDLNHREDREPVGSPTPEDINNLDTWCIVDKNQVVLDLEGFTKEFETYARIIPALLDVKPPSRPEYVPNLSGLVKKKDGLPQSNGQYSTVFMGEYRGVAVAIKVLRLQKDTTGATIMRRFWRETLTWWCLDHENILRLYGVVKPGEFGTFGAMISPWCENGPASKYLPNNLDNRGRLEAFHGVAKGLGHLHSHSIVHGDLKPSNVVIDKKGVAKICDFGLLRLIRDQSTGLTTATCHTGSIRYLSFELISVEDAEPTRESDVHALGCVGMEFIYSWIPYQRILSDQHRADYRIGKAIESGEPPALRPKNTSESVSELWNIIESTWVHDPQARPGASAISQFLANKWETIARELGPNPMKPTSEPISQQS